MRHARHMLRAASGLVLGMALVVLAAAAALGQDWGEVRVAAYPTNIRKQGELTSPVVRSLKPGDKVRVDFVRPTGWGAVFDLGEKDRDEAKALGYADVRLLKPVDAVATARPVQAAAAEPERALGRPAEPLLMRVVEARTEIHKERSLKSPVVAVLAPGERVRTGFARDGFLAVFRQDDPGASEAKAVGYVPEGMVKALPAQATAARPVELKAAQAAKAEGKSVPAPEVKGEVRKSQAPTGGQPTLSGQEPVRITSDKMVYNQADNSVSFIGNVHGTHTDMAIWAERITAFFSDKKKGKDPKRQDQDKGGAGEFGDAIERIVAEGNVRMVANKNEGACAKLTYIVPEGVIRMDGNPILREGQNTVRGESIKFYVRENRSEVLSGEKRRVEAVFFTPKGEQN